MKRSTIVVIGFILTLMGITRLSAQPVEHGKAKSLIGIEVHFRFDRSELDLDYMGNRQALDRFSEAIDSIGVHMIDSIIIVSHSSPEGSYRHNIRLSERRAATMRTTIQTLFPDLSSFLSVHSSGESWDQLRDYVTADEKMKRSTINDVLKVIDSDVNIDTKKWRMQQLPIYRYLLQTYYPRLRNSVFCIVYFSTPPVPAVKSLTVNSIPHITDCKPISRTYEFQPKPSETRLLVKTNLINDVLLSPSLEVEYKIADHWSVQADYSIAWWSNKRLHKYYQLMQFGAEGRYWFNGERHWHGHYVGVFAGAGYYDLQNGWDGYQGEYIMSGLSYGYMLPIGRRLSLDAGIGVGALTTVYEEYLPIEGHSVYQQTSRTNYIGPLRLRLALTWKIDHKKFRMP